MDMLPKPFGYVRDNYGQGHVFQHTPFSESESLTCSTDQVYSYAQMREAVQGSRKQALQQAYEAMFDIKGDKVTRFDAQTAIRALEGDGLGQRA